MGYLDGFYKTVSKGTPGVAINPAEIDRRTGVSYGRNQNSVTNLGKAVADAAAKKIAQNKSYEDTYNSAKNQMNGQSPYVSATTDNYMRTLGSVPNSPGGSSGGGGSGGGGGYGAALNAFNQQKQETIDTINGIKVESGTAYEEAVKKLQEHYGDAAVGRGESFAAGYSELADNLKNLGIDFASGDLAKDWDADKRTITEAADTALATDLAWFEKMKTLQQDLYNTMLTEISRAQMGMGGGGGGGRRGGGGYGGSSSGDTSVTETGTAYNPLLAAALQGMDPMYQLAYDAAGHNPTTAASNAAKAVLKAMAINAPSVSSFKPSWNVSDMIGSLSRSVSSNVANRAVNQYKDRVIRDNTALNSFYNQYSPGRSPQVTKVTTSTKGKG